MRYSSLKIKALFCLIASLLLSNSNGQNAFLQWVNPIGSFSQERGYSVGVDNSGNVYTVGSFSTYGSYGVDFDSGPGVYTLTTNSVGGRDLFITKHNALGTFQWVKRIGGIATNEAFSIAIEIVGDLLVTGVFHGPVDFDPGPGVFNLAQSGAFALKLDNSGAFIWAKNLGGSVGKAISSDGTGDIYVTGAFSGTADFDPGPSATILTSNGIDDIFVTKLDSWGNLIWARQMGGHGNDIGMSVVTNSLGDVFTTGTFGDTTDFDPGITTHTLSTSNGKIFVSKLDAAGNFVWVKSFGSSLEGAGQSIKLDGAGNIYTTGWFRITGDFDPGSNVYILSNPPGNQIMPIDIFFSKLDPLGNFVWAKNIGGASDDRGFDLELDGAGNIYVTGFFNGTVDFDPGPANYTLSTNWNAGAGFGSGDIYILKLNSFGIFLSARSLSSSSSGSGEGIVVNAQNNIYITGYYNGNIDFDPAASSFTIGGQGGDDIFIEKLCQMIEPSILTNGSTTFCSGGSVNLTSTASYQYYWNTGATSQMVAIDSSGNYFVSVTSSLGCTSVSGSVSVSVRPLPLINIVSSSPTICAGQSVSLSANGTANSYTWNTSQFGANIIATPLTSGNYTVVGTDINGCENISTLFQVVEACTVIEEFKRAAQIFTAYPNPSVGDFTLETNLTGEIRIANLLGENISSARVEGFQTKISLKDFMDGIYVITLIRAGEKYIQKLIKLN